jgi:hypothetical protein
MHVVLSASNGSPDTFKHTKGCAFAFAAARDTAITGPLIPTSGQMPLSDTLSTRAHVYAAQDAQPCILHCLDSVTAAASGAVLAVFCQ